MKKDEKFVITINRELGSGGRTIARKVADRLGVALYDKVLIKTLEEKYNLTSEEIEKLKGHSHSWWEDFKRVARLGEGWLMDLAHREEAQRLFEQPTTSGEIFKAETEILQGIAENESCVITGRSAFYVFRAHPNHLSIFIQASLPYRVERVIRKQNISRDTARKTIEKVDKMRENYVNKFTGTSRYDTRNYDLVVYADCLSEDEIVDVIMKFIK
jgi:cytidylate kinase